MMAQVARGNAQLADGDPRALKRLSVQFRGMGFPEQELVVTGTVKEVDGDRVVIDTSAAQGDNQVIRNAEAELGQYPGVPIISSVLSERQSQILRRVVERYVDDGRPVGSRALANRADIDWSSSTVRAELAGLEEEGFLTHPHTSAGRVPTDSRLPLLRGAAAGPAGPAAAAAPRTISASRACAARSTSRFGRRPPRSPRSPIWWRWSRLRRSTRRRSTGSRCCGCSRGW